MNLDLSQLSKEELRGLVEKTSWNAGFGCYTKTGFENIVWPRIAQDARWIVYFDVDGVHNLNEHFGDYDHVDAMIYTVFDSLRSTDYVAGQNRSGDEFLICMTEQPDRAPLDPIGLKNRVVAELKKQGLTATFAVVPVHSLDLKRVLQPAIELVDAAKKARGSSR